MLGLDGVGWPLLRPMFDAGHMPRLRTLLERGASGVLTSTVPPFTPPGWTSVFTGVNPGKHGIFGFTSGNAQRGQELVRLDRVKAPAIWNAAAAAGMQVGLFNVPMTYPPPPLSGWAVSGMMTPEEAGFAPPNFTYPSDLLSDLISAGLPYHIDIEVDYDKDWRSAEIIDRLSSNLEVKRHALRHLLATRGDLGILFTVFEGPDRLMHVHYKYLDPACEHFERPEGEAIRERAWAYFDEIDEVIGDLLSWAGDDGFVVTMSDHGFQGKNASVNANLALLEWGLLSMAGAGKLASNESLRRVAGKVKRFLPDNVRGKAKSVAVSIDWSQTKAFCSPNPQQGIYVNLTGREPNGIVAPADRDRVCDEVIERFLGWRDPRDGAPVAERVLRREEVMEGPEAESAPDLFPVCRGYSYELNDSLYSEGPLTDYRAEPRGFHHMDGIFGIAGPGVQAAPDLTAGICDIAPTVLYLAGVPAPESDGKVLSDHLPKHLLAASSPVSAPTGLPLAGEGAEASPYTEEEAARIEESLRNLGYL